MVLNTVILDACKKDDEFTAAVARCLSERLSADSAVRTVELADRQIASCTGCFGCWVKTPGICVIDDECRGITRLIASANRLVFLTPVVFGGYHPDLKTALERSIGILLPFLRRFRGELHHPRRIRNLSCEFIAMGITDRPDGEVSASFRKRAWRNALNLNGLKWNAGTIDRSAGTAGVVGEVGRILSGMEAL